MFSAKHAITLLLVLVSTCVMLAFAVLLSWFMDFVANASPDKNAAVVSAQKRVSELPLWKWVVFGCLGGVFLGLSSYLLHSGFAHHWTTGYPALQIVLGRFLGMSVFGTLGALILVRKVHAKSWGIFFVYLMGGLAVGPLFVEAIMRSFGLPVIHLP